MGLLNEETLTSWTKRASDTEELKIENAVNMIKSAVSSSEEMKNLQYEIFVQGSYANNTNVKNDSDVDVNVMLLTSIFTQEVEGIDYGYTPGTISYYDYKNYVLNALNQKFGSQNVNVGNKSIKVSSNTYRVDADCIVSFQYRNHEIINSRSKSSYVEGIKFIAKDGTEIINYPKDHIKNGIKKNNNTKKEYKKLVRIFKRIRNKMVDEGLTNKDVITSFLVECLVWNVPNDKITNTSSWNDAVKESIIYLYNKINDNECNEWGEVSERLYLFRGSRKWTKTDAKDFLHRMWNYLGYGNE